MAKPNRDDDLFSDSTMTFGEHLEELRSSLFRALVGLVVGFVVGLFVAKYIVELVKSPLSAALKEYYLASAMDKLDQEFKQDPPPEHTAIITEQGLIPESVYMEPAVLLEQLRIRFPDQMSGVHLEEHLFSTEDLRLEDLSELCKTLARHEAVGQSKATIKGLLSDEDQKTLADIAKKREAGADDHRRVVAVLNRLINSPKLHEGELFESLKDDVNDPRVASAVDSIHTSLQGQSDKDQTRRLNRLLISGALADYIKPAQSRLMELKMWKPASVKIQTLGVHEGFMILIKAALISGLIFSSPWVFYQIWEFVAAGLYPQEKRFVHIFLPFSLALFLGGAALAFFFVFEPVLNFLLSFNRTLNISAEPRMSEWLSFVLFLPLGFGVSFQLPLVMLFLERIGILDVAAYLNKWRVAILVIFFISMLLTPADPVSMLLMALPLTILYFGGIALCHWLPRRSSPIGEGYEP